MDLDLAACPICRARGSFARGTTEVEGRSRVTYECVECGSVLVRLGDDLWMEGDRWAYQRVGREGAAFLLHRPLTVGELQWLARDDRQSWPSGPEPLAASTQPSAGSDRPPAVSRQSSAIPDQRAEYTGLGDEQEVRQAQGAVPVVEPPPTRIPVRQRSSGGSPLLMNSMLLILLCLIMYVTAMIAVKGVRDRVPESTPPDTTPTAALSKLLPPRIPLVTQTPLPDEAPLVTEASLPTGTPPVTDTLPVAEIPGVTATPLPASTLSAPGGLLPTDSTSTAVRLQGVTDYLAPTGIYYVLGEVVNTTGENLRSVDVLVIFYDAGGQVIATDSTSSELSVVEAAETAPFKLAVPPPAPSFATYKLRADYTATGEDLLRLEVLSHSAYTDQDGRYHIAGQVRNPHGIAVKSPKIVATYYDAANQVVRVESAFGQIDPLAPDTVSPFDIVLADPPVDLDHYALQTEAAQQ